MAELVRLTSIAKLSDKVIAEQDQWYSVLGIQEFCLVDNETGYVYDRKFVDQVENRLTAG